MLILRYKVLFKEDKAKPLETVDDERRTIYFNYYYFA